MKTSKTVLYGAYALALIFIHLSCDDISHGQQRRKFEFLYKMNNYATVFREYTSDINYLKDIELYEIRMKKLSDDVSKSETVSGWEHSAKLKTEFLDTIRKNLELAGNMKQRLSSPDQVVRGEYEIVNMQNSESALVESINEAIVDAGKE